MTNSERWARREALRVVGGAAVGSAMVSGIADRVTGQSGESWTQPGYDSANTGHAPNNTGPVADIKTQWTYKSTTNRGLSSPAVVESIVYTVSGNTVYALAAEDGTVYVGTHDPDSTLYALTGKTSTLATTTETTVPETIEAAQQQGTSATNLTSTPDDRETEISVFSFFSDSTVPAVIIGGATTILGLGSVYAA